MFEAIIQHAKQQIIIINQFIVMNEQLAGWTSEC